MYDVVILRKLELQLRLITIEIHFSSQHLSAANSLIMELEGDFRGKVREIFLVERLPAFLDALEDDHS